MSENSLQTCSKCSDLRTSYDRLAKEHAHCTNRLANQQDVIGKMEAAVKLLNKMLHDDKKHRVFLQERLDTAEQALYLRTCLADLQQSPVRRNHNRHKSKSKRRQSNPDVTEPVSAVFIPATKVEGSRKSADLIQLTSAPFDQSSPIKLNQPSPNLQQPVSQPQSQEPVKYMTRDRNDDATGVKREVLENRLHRFRPPEKEEIPMIVNRSGFLTKAAAASDDISSDNETTEEEEEDNTTIDTDDLSSAANAPPPPPRSKTQTHQTIPLGNAQRNTSLDGRLDVRKQVSNLSNHPVTAADPVDHLKRSRKDQLMTTLTELGHEAAGDQGKASDVKRVTVRQQIPKAVASAAPVHQNAVRVAKILKAAQTSGYKEWKRQQATARSSFSTFDGDSQRPPRLKRPVKVASDTANVHPQGTQSDFAVTDNDDVLATKRGFPIARPTKSMMLKNGFTKLKYENPEQQWVSRAGPARG